MKILLVTDAWEPQVNGVVRTYQNIIKILKTRDVDIQVVHPHYKNFKTIPLPGYPEIEIATNPKLLIVELEQALSSNRHIHIATEGPLGLTARIYLAKRGYPFTTGFHTLFPEFIQKRFYIPAKILYPFFRWFHNRAVATLVPTTKIRDQLIDKGFSKPSVWTRGVDFNLFNPSRRTNPSRYIVYVARASKEKNIDEFCNLNYDRKIFVGDGPYLPELKQRYPEVEFVGKKQGPELAELIANADVFVFPSKADTFGIVILEAIACGTPVAAYQEPGPLEVIQLMRNGHCSKDLQVSVNFCTTIDREEVYKTSTEWTWERSADNFIEGITHGRQSLYSDSTS